MAQRRADHAGRAGELRARRGSALISQYDVQPMVQIHASTQDRDLGAVAADIRQVLADTAADVPKGSSVEVLGQVRTMERAFSGLLYGLLGAVVLIYLLIVVNFQSWLDPAVIVSALPAALAGIVWMLFATEHHAVGAGADRRHHVHGRRHRQQRAGDLLRPRASRRVEGRFRAAIEAGFVRFRPVLMTALAMIIGMLPMAFGMGEGGEQNAPLGRAVIGGLLFSTVATLLFVPVVFSLVHDWQERRAGKAHLQISIGAPSHAN
jgi:multidrug efflux pump subunit AcrB